ncbi:hypothetical protein KC337_g8258, partial [Hortaea werneckii]
MSGLVGYGSSDEDDDELQPEKPAKMARLDDDAGLQATNDAMGAQTTIAPETQIQEPPTAPYAPVKEAPTQPDEPPLGPAPGPAAPPPPAAAAAVQDDYGNRDLAPYERGRKDLKRIVKAFEDLPPDVAGFYLER